MWSALARTYGASSASKCGLGCLEHRQLLTKAEPNHGNHKKARPTSAMAAELAKAEAAHDAAYIGRGPTPHPSRSPAGSTNQGDRDRLRP